MVEKLRLTAAEFWKLPETNQPIELVNGEMIVRPMPTLNHQRVVGKVLFLLDSLIPNGEVLPSPIGMYLDDENVIQPEISWIAANSRCVIGEQWLEGAPDLVVEVLSTGWKLHDRKTKFSLYEKYGVREYWMIDPEEEYVEVYRHENGSFVRQGVYGPDETFESAVLGKVVELQGIFGS